MAPILLIAIIFRTMEAFKTFDLAYIMTSQPTTELIAIRLYKMAFQEWQTGTSCALAYIVLIMVLAITNIYVKYLNQREGALRWPPSSIAAQRLLQPRSRSPRSLLVTLIFLAPIYWIASTAFKPRDLATTVPPTVFFEPEMTPFVKLFTKRVQMTRAGRRPRSMPRRPGGRSAIYDGGERVVRDGKGEVQLSAYPEPLHQQPDRRDHQHRCSRSAWARSPPTASRASG